MAKIQSVKDASSGAMMKMVVYDGTGSFNVEHYMPQDDEQVHPSAARKRACLQTSTKAKFCGVFWFGRAAHALDRSVISPGEVCLDCLAYLKAQVDALHAGHAEDE